ncbi:MAG: hypothetical protein PHF11_07100 [Candidatus Omnitrophica bacterium]|nr:hypothetical protein [Candidatus Omnitrophota bacterium]
MDKISINRQIEPSWDTYSITVISVFVFLGILQWSFFPRFIDIYYHLSVMLGLDQSGGFFTKEFLEYAPVGRPHIYPPLLHIFMLLLYKLGLSKIFIARLLGLAIYPLTLTVIWQVLRNVFSPRLAFFAILSCASAYSFYLAVGNLLPFSAALVLALLVFLCIEKNKAFAAGLLLGLTFYTHALMSWMALLCILLYGTFNYMKRRQSFKACLFAVITALPMLLYQYYSRMYFKLAPPNPNTILEINVFVYLLSIAGIAAAFRKKGSSYFFICLIVAMLALAFTHKTRYLSGHGLIGFALASGLAIDNLYQRIVLRRFELKKLLVFMLALLFALLVFNPTLYIDKSRREIFIRLFNPPLVNLMPKYKQYVYLNDISIYHRQFMDDIVRVIERNTAKDDIIYSNLNYQAGLLSVLSERATSQAMMPEVRPYRDFDPVGAAKVIIWFKDPDGAFPQQLSGLVPRYKLAKLEETDLAYIYANPSASAKSKVSRNILPTSALFFILLFIAGLVIYALKR